MERINIMTSCNDGIAQYILPQLASIGVNLSNYQVEFYLFHSSISPEKVHLIREYSRTFANIWFNEVVIENTEPYEKLLKGGGQWPPEAYYSLCCHQHLPNNIDRILYIDTGDIIIDGDIAEYYFGDFEGCSIIATPFEYVTDSGEHRLFVKDDINDQKLSKSIRTGIFNSGAYVINVAKLRACKLTMDDFIYVANVITDIYYKEDSGKVAYSGDQGLLSVTFLGDIRFFGYPEIKNAFYMPYNFCSTYFFESSLDLWYTPKILHYVGSPLYKPWNARFSVEETAKYNFQSDYVGNKERFYITGKHIEFLEKWWHYCEMTPIYDELNKVARIYASALETYYLPLCKRFNDLVDSCNQRKEG